MRRYILVFNGADHTCTLAFRDDNDPIDVFSVDLTIPTMQSKDTAIQIRDALNEKLLREASQ